MNRKEIIADLVNSPVGREKMFKTLLAPLVPEFKALPEGSKCPKCSAVWPDFGIHHAMISRWGGKVECKSCDFTQGAYQWWGSQMFTVVPMTAEEIAEHQKAEALND